MGEGFRIFKNLYITKIKTRIGIFKQEIRKK